MFTRRATAGITLGALALATFGAASPSGAADVTVQFTVSSAGGGLAVASAASSDTLSGATTNLLSTATISDTLPAVTVTDQRASALAAWKVEVAGTSFVNQSDNAFTIPASASRIYINATDVAAGTLSGVLGGMVVTGGQNNTGTANIGTKYTLLNGNTLALLTGSVTFTPTMDVTVPAGAAVGIYQNTVTYTAT